MRNAWNNARHLIECDVARTTSSSSVKSPRGPNAKPAASNAEGFSDAFCRCAAAAALGHTIWMGLILTELLGYNST